MKTIIIMNEQHALLPEQNRILRERFGEWETLNVPASGWNKEERDEICRNLSGNVVFVSPIPGMIKGLAIDITWNICHSGSPGTYVWVFANDAREKKELPNGKVVSVTAQTGWYIE